MTNNSSLPCDIVQDLLPSYADGILSDTGTAVVAKHLQSCEHCHDIYHAMVNDEPHKATSDQQEKEIDYLKKVRSKTRHFTITAILIAVLLAGSGTAVYFLFFSGEYILNSVKKAILNPESVDVDKLSDNIDSFYETITGCSPTSNSVLVVLVEKYGINYSSNHIDDRFNNFMKDKNLIKNIPSTRVKSSDLYDIVDRLDRSNIPRLIQQMTSFDKWSKEDKFINNNTVIDVMPDRASYFNTAITGLVGDDLPFITSATDSRVIPIRSGTSTKYYYFIMRNNKPLLLYKLLPVDGGLSRYFAISLDPENELIGEITKDNNVTTEFVCENPNIALGKFFME